MMKGPVLALVVLMLAALGPLVAESAPAATSTSAQRCPASSVCPNATGADARGCCSDIVNSDCCDSGGGVRYCTALETDNPCCSIDSDLCTTADIPTCIPKTQLCGGKCCLDNDGRVTTCCNKKCCKYAGAKCRKGKCTTKCVTSVGGRKRTQYCKEPKVCCQGHCVDPKKGNAALPCKGLCCEFKSFLAISGFHSEHPKNGVCCHGACCTDEQTCCRGPDGVGCGIKCANKCCRKGTNCCNGKCVADAEFCSGQCCTGGSKGACCGGGDGPGGYPREGVLLPTLLPGQRLLL